MRKVLVCGVVAGLMSVALLTGCGGNASSSSSAAASSGAADASSAAVSSSAAASSSSSSAAASSSKATTPSKNNAATSNSAATNKTEPAKTIAPLPSNINPKTVTDATVRASFSSSDFKTQADGYYSLNITIYDVEYYDAVDVSQMKVGDTFVTEGKSHTVKSLENQGAGILINGDIELYSYGGGTYSVCLPNDQSVMAKLGTVLLPLALGTDLTVTDSSDLNNPAVVMNYDDFVATFRDDPNTDFNESNTFVTITGGKITDISKVYTP